MSRALISILGFLLLVLGGYIAVFVENRSEALVIFLLAFGGFMVSKSLVTEFFRDIYGQIASWRK